MLNEDYKDLLLALSAEKVRYLLAGAYALAAHGYPRATMGIDVWVNPDEQLLTVSLHCFLDRDHDLASAANSVVVPCG